MTDEAAKDYDETQLIPDPTWAERLVTWFKLLLGLKKTIMVLMGVGVIGVGGNIAEVNPWKEAAIEVGLIDPGTNEAPPGVEHNHDVVLDDLMNLQAEVAQLHEEMTKHGHALPEGVAGIAGIAGPPGPAGKDGKDGKDGLLTQDGLAAAVEKLLPPNHKSLH